jgi:chlorinating enzyme
MRTATEPRLTQDQVDFYKREGYLAYKQPVFSPERFKALKDHFEEKLARLPANIRPESMDVPHFVDLKLFDWLLSDEVLDLVEPVIGPDIALWSSHFICKPKGDGRRVPWHEDSAYWKGRLDPMEVVTVWLSIDPSSLQNGCMKVIPRTHSNGYSEYEPVDATRHVFSSEIKRHQFDEKTAVALELQPNEASLHNGKLMHSSEANTSAIRRCGYTMRYIPTHVKLQLDKNSMHKIFLARGRDRAGNSYGDPTKCYEELRRYKEQHGNNGH